MHRPETREVSVAACPSKANLALCLGVVLIYWLWLFWPAIVRHQNLMGYHLLPPEVVGSERTQTPSGKYWIPVWPTGDWSLHLVHLPYQAFLAREFKDGTFPLWNPEIGCGQPVTSDPQYKPFNPFFLPFYLSPSAWSFSIGMALMALSGMIGYTLFFREMKFSVVPVIFFGITAAWNPLTQQTISLSSSWVYWMAGWGLWGAVRWSHGCDCGPLISAAACALSLFCGHPVIAAYWTVLLVAFLGFLSVDMSRRSLCMIPGFMAIVAVLTSVQTLPFLAEFSHYWSYKSDWDGGPFLDWAMLGNPNAVLYIPMPIWGLSCIGLFLNRSKIKWFFLFCLLYGVMLVFPLVESGPVRWILSLGGSLVARYGEEPFWLGLAGLSALGVVCITEVADVKRLWPPLRFFGYGIGAYYLSAWLVMTRRFTFYWPGIYRSFHRLELLACALIIVLLLASWSRQAKLILQYGMLGLVMVAPFAPSSVDKYWSLQDFVANPPYVIKPVVEDETARREYRISGEYSLKLNIAALPPNQGLYWGISDIRLCSPIALKGFADFSDEWQIPDLRVGGQRYFPKETSSLLKFLGVRWVLRMTSTLATDNEQKGPLLLEAIDGASPWVRGVGNWEVEKDRDVALAKTRLLIKDGGWRNVVLLDKNPSIPVIPELDWEAPEISWLKNGPDEWAWKVTAKTQGLLVILQNSHPGWKVSMDGHRVRPCTAYGAFVAVPYDPGIHRIEMTFHEPWFFVGLWVSLAGWVSLLVWAAIILGRAGRKNKRAPTGS